MDTSIDNRDAQLDTELPTYETPTIQVMDEDKILEFFQVAHAAVSWWVM